MRISANYFRSLHTTSSVRQTPDRPAVSSAHKSHDEITITSASSDTLDTKFAAMLKTALTEEIQKPTPEAKLDDLQRKIEDGAYQVSANAIAEKILLYKGAETDG